ncbi:MAG: transposase, partial [Chloroflexota bacterium]
MNVTYQVAKSDHNRYTDNIMTEKVPIRQTYKYRLYRCDKRDKYLHQMIDIAGIIWNRCLALQKRYYRRFGKYVSQSRLKSHIAHLRGKTEKYAYWEKVGSQAVQDVIERLDRAYKRFFKKEAGLPRFKKVKKYSSFTLKQTAGWKMLPDLKVPNAEQKKRGIGQVTISNRRYKFIKHRELKGDIKTVTIKRDACGRLWICFSVVEEIALPKKVSTGKSGGFDFGLCTFLIDHTGKQYHAPEPFKLKLAFLKAISRAISRKVKGSGNHKRANWQRNRTYIKIADQRRDFHYKLAHALCKEYDHFYFEDLTLDGMKRMWGRKVSDLGFGKFLKILERVAIKLGKTVTKIDPFAPTSQTCSQCGHRQKLSLSDRVFDC